jgi:hypothetical protein
MRNLKLRLVKKLTSRHTLNWLSQIFSLCQHHPVTDSEDKMTNSFKLQMGWHYSPAIPATGEVEAEELQAVWAKLGIPYLKNKIKTKGLVMCLKIWSACLADTRPWVQSPVQHTHTHKKIEINNAPSIS